MMFTIGSILMMLGFLIGHTLGDPMPSAFGRWNKYDYIGVSMFVVGLLLVLSSIFTITWKYMP